MEITFIVDVLCLADGTLYCSWFLDVDVWLDAHHADDAVVEWLDVWHLLGRVG